MDNGPPSTPGVVLHIEDDPEVGAGVATLLRSYGYRALTAVDGPEALQLVRPGEPPPDLLIVDFNLPGDMDGADAAEAVCRAVGHVLPTVILSGELTSAGLPWLPGAPLFLARKPIDPEIFLQVVESFITLGRMISRPRAPKETAGALSPLG
jgi:two-component system, chemotaxis family, CheB/CheR fusion protein